MKEKKIKILWSLVMVISLLLWGGGTGYAKVTGVCSGCHTMHNSQGGIAMGTTDAQPALLLNDCLGCHTGTNTGSNTTPYVYKTSEPSKILAGGSFWYSSNDVTTGHNVAGAGTTSLTSPPGYDGGRADSNDDTPGGGTSWNIGTYPLTCAGEYGCHGDHSLGNNSLAGVSGAHHTNTGGSLDTAGTVATSYRFLIGIKGYEETGWEYAPTSAVHNQYKGVTRAGSELDDTSTISWLCGECHGEYHTQTTDVGTASPWVRHPTDLSLNDVTGTEYASYNAAADSAAATYSVIAPVASTNIGAILDTVNVTKDNAADEAIVTCISCHRAHGSPNSSLLRWAYTMDAGSSSAGDDNTGCFICHTTKDDE